MLLRRERVVLFHVGQVSNLGFLLVRPWADGQQKGGGGGEEGGARAYLDLHAICRSRVLRRCCFEAVFLRRSCLEPI